MANSNRRRSVSAHLTEEDFRKEFMGMVHHDDETIREVIHEEAPLSYEAQTAREEELLDLGIRIHAA